MSIATRYEQIVGNVNQYSLLTGIENREEVCQKAAKGEVIHLPQYSAHQTEAAKLAAIGQRLSVFAAEAEIAKHEVVLESLAVPRPKLMRYAEDYNNRPYQEWQRQHNLTIVELATEWMSSDNIRKVTLWEKINFSPYAGSYEAQQYVQLCAQLSSEFEIECNKVKERYLLHKIQIESHKTLQHKVNALRHLTTEYDAIVAKETDKQVILSEFIKHMTYLLHLFPEYRGEILSQIFFKRLALT